tara:strand:- start:1446 stop:2087 length:642 start_codon:yes stop_codon:yes gene_type:complete
MKLEDNFTVSSITSKETYDWLLYKHYLKRIPSISFSFGLFDGSVLVGVVTYGTPASNSLCVGLCGKEYKSIVLELNRLCINDELPSNCASFFISRTFKLLPKPTILVSYADKSFGHTGYIYQATNWIYTGLSDKRRERYNPDDLEKHGRHISSLDFPLRDRPRKHRYVYFIGSKKDKKVLKNKLLYPIKEYPKFQNKNYDASFKPSVQIDMFK